MFGQIFYSKLNPFVLICPCLYLSFRGQLWQFCPLWKNIRCSTRTVCFHQSIWPLSYWCNTDTRFTVQLTTNSSSNISCVTTCQHCDLNKFVFSNCFFLQRTEIKKELSSKHMLRWDYLFASVFSLCNDCVKHPKKQSCKAPTGSFRRYVNV